jgi:AraC-like DNA-binding protein
MFGNISWLNLFVIPPPQRPRVCEAAQRGRLLRIGYDILEECEAEPLGWEISVRLSLLRGLFLLSRNWTPPTIIGKKHYAIRANLAEIMPALRLVHTRPNRKVSLAEAAAVCTMSRAQFCRVFHKVIGQGFGAFCESARLALVAQQLLSSDATIQTIAAQVGFTYASHLHRNFVKRYDCTPGEFRERSRRTDSE